MDYRLAFWGGGHLAAQDELYYEKVYETIKTLFSLMPCVSDLQTTPGISSNRRNKLQLLVTSSHN